MEDGLKGEIPASIIKVLLKVQKDLRPLIKSADNSAYDSKFTPLPEVMTAALEKLNRHGVAVVQSPTLTPEGASAFKTTLAHKDGDTYTEVTKLAIEKINPQSHASAITYMRRYQLMAMLGLTSEDDDDDGNKAAGVSGKARPEQIARVKSLLQQLKFPPDQIAREVRNIYTTDHAAAAIINFEHLISQRMRNREAEANAIEAEKSTRIDVTDGPSEDQAVGERIKALGLNGKAAENKFIHYFTGKPMLANCNAEDLEKLAHYLDLYDQGTVELPNSWFADGVAPSKAAAAGTKEGDTKQETAA